MCDSPLNETVEERLITLTEDFIEENVESQISELKKVIREYNSINKVSISPTYLEFIEEAVSESFYSFARFLEEYLIKYSKEIANQFDISDKMHSDLVGDLSHWINAVKDLENRVKELENKI